MKKIVLFLMVCFFIPVLTFAQRNEEKEEKDGGPGAVMEFEFERTKDPATGKVPRERYLNALYRTLESKNNAASRSTTAFSWIERGPTSDVPGPSNGNTRANSGLASGRIRAVMVDSTDATHKTVFVGGVDGGLWKTTDITATTPTWTLVNDFLSNLAVSAICQDPRPGFQNIMYFCTGEAYYNADAVQGNGVFKSTNGGVTWSYLSSTSTYVNCTRILCDFQGNIYLATRGSGLLRSTAASGGAAWTNITPTGLVSDICDLEISSTSAAGRLHMVAGIFSTQAYRYTDIPATVTSGTWTSPAAAFPSFSMRCEIACSGNTLYALPANASYQVPTIYKSTNGGANWSATTGQPTSGWASGQGWYSLAVDIDPSNTNNCIVGGLDTWKTTDGGSSWTKISAWVGTTGQYVHADQHKIVWYDGGNKLIFASDGGIFYSSDKGTTIRDRNQGLRIKQFYSCAIHPTTTNYFLAGAQDNGVHQFNNPGLSNTIEVTGGDGALVAIDQNESQYQFGSYVFNNYRRSTNSGTGWSSVNFYKGSAGVYNVNYFDFGSFINPFDYDNTNNIMYSGADAGEFFRWTTAQTAVAGTYYTGSGFPAGASIVTGITGFNGSTVSTVFVSPYTANLVYFGTAGGRVVKIAGANTAPNGTAGTNISGVSFPAGNVSCINAGTNDNNLITCFSNYGVSNIWVTTNGGTSWTAVDGNLPDMPVRWCMFYPGSNTKAIIATETGVWQTDLINGASTVWVAESGFPTVRTDMLEYRITDGTLAAATHGRGLWTTTLCNPSISVTPSSSLICNPGGASVTLTASGAVTYTWAPSTGLSGTTGTSVTANPASTTTYTITGTDAIGCVATTTATVTVATKPTVSFSGLSSPVCATSAAQTLTGSPAGGTFSGPGISGNTFTPATAGAGTHNIVYTYTDIATGCSNTSTQTVTVDAMPPAVNITAGGSTAICSGSSVTLTASTIPTNDLSFTTIFTGTTGVDQWQSFVPTMAGVTTGIQVQLNGIVSTTLTLSVYSGLGTGGVLVYSGIIPLSGASGFITLSVPNLVLTPGLTYTFRLQSPVNIPLVANNSGYGTYFSNVYGTPSWRLNFKTNVTPTLGNVQWYQGAVAIPAATNPTYVVSAAGIYSCKQINGTCTSAISNTINVTVNPLPSVSFTGLPAAICVTGSAVTLTGSPAGGTFSGPGITGNSFNPTTAGVGGPYTITYSYTDGNGCTNTATNTVTVTVVTGLTISASTALICGSGNAVLSVAEPLTTAYCNPVSSVVGSTGDFINNVNFNAGAINNTTGDGPGDFNDYSGLIANVTAGSTYSISVTTDIAWPQGKAVWIDYNRDGDFNDPGEYVWSAPSAVGNASGSFTIPANAFNGITRMRVGCMYNQNTNSTQSCSFPSYGEYEDYRLNISGCLGASTYSWSPATFLSSTNCATVNVTGINTTTTYTVTVTDPQGCTGTKDTTIVVNPVPVFTVTATPASFCGAASGNSVLTVANYCIPAVSFAGITGDYISQVYFNGGAINNSTGDGPGDYNDYPVPVANITAGLNYSIIVTTGPSYSQGKGVWIDFNQDGDFDDANEFVWSSPVSTGSASGSITIPANAFNGVTRMRVGCVYAQTAFAGQSCSFPSFGEYEDYRVNISGGSPLAGFTWSPPTFLSATTGATVNVNNITTTTTYTVTATGLNGCTSSQNVTVSLFPLPTVSFSGLPGFICNTGGAVTLTGSPAGGVFTGLGISGNTFDPASAGVGGPFTITYTYFDGNGCSNSSSQNVVVNSCVGNPLSGIQETYSIFNINGTGNTYYDMKANTANPDFQGAFLGSFTINNLAQTLVLKGGQNKVYKCTVGDITGNNMYYRVYKTGNTPGAFSNLPLGFLSELNNICGGKDQVWEDAAQNINLLQNLVPGNYTVEVFSTADNNIPGVWTANNSGANYKASFTVLPDPANPVNVTCTGGVVFANYPTLADAFAAVNAGTHTGTIAVTIYANTIEPATGAILNASGAGSASYSSMTVNPSGAILVSGTISPGLPLINFNGADNVIIDGLNSGGNSLTIENTTVSVVVGTSTVQFIDGATGNTITRCTLKGAGTSSSITAGAIVFFYTDAVTGNGNDNNTISNCDIGPSGPNLPAKAILGIGSTTTTANGNSGIIIDNNDIHDFFGPAVSSSGVVTTAGCNTWSITNNRFYQTGARTWTTGATHRAIDINNTTSTSGAQGFTITGNKVGYASNTQTGTYTLTGSTGKFQGIVYNGITGGTVSTVSNNTVSSVNLSGVISSGTSITTPFAGILLINGVVNSHNNIVGSQSAINDLVFSTNTTLATDVYGIFNFTLDNWNADFNTVGGISVTNAGASGTFLVYGMRANISTTKTWNATSNVIGGNIANSIQLNATGVGSQVVGMQTPNVISTLTLNTIRNLSTNIGTGTTTNASVAGIIFTSTTPNQVVSQNTIYNLTNTNSTGASVVTGIQFTGGTGANLVQRNLIYDLSVATNSTAAEVNGIRIAGGTTTYRNNMIRLGAGIPNAIGTGSTGGVSGILEALGTNNFFHNSIYIDGTPATGAGPSFAFNGQQVTNSRSFRDNIFFNARSNSGATGKHYAVRVGGTTPNPPGLTINNNIYHASGSGNVFGFFNSLDVPDLVSWQAAVGQDVNSLNVNPAFVSGTDLHLQAGSPAIDIAANLGVVNDFDGDSRPGNNAFYDIGADERDGIPAVTNDIQATAFIDPSNGGAKAIGATFSPQASFTNNGTSNQSNITVRYRICTDGTCTTVLYNQTATIASLNTLATTNVTFPSISIATPGTYVIKARAELPGDLVPANDEITGTIQIMPPLAGTYTVGTGGNYPSLTNPAGIFETLNNLGASGNITINIISDLGGETGTNSLNELAGGYSVLIHPAGGPRTVTGSINGALIKLNGADGVTIDGSVTGAAAAPCLIGGDASIRQLTIQNTNTGTSAAVISVQSGTNGAQNNTIKNVNVLGQDPTTTLAGISIGGTIPVTTGADNDNNHVENCSVKRAIFGIYSAGLSAANQNLGTVISQNDLSALSTDRIRRLGILIINDDGAQVKYNSIGGMNSNESADAIGISLGIQLIDVTTIISGNVTNALVANNKVNGIESNASAGFSAVGIAAAGGSTGANIIRNNMISGVIANSTSPDIPAGIYVAGAAGSNTKLYFNSVSMTGTRGATLNQLPSYGIAITGFDPVVEIKNNIVYNTLEPGGGGVNAKNYAVGMVTTSFVNLNSNYNNYWSTGTQDGGFRTGSLAAGAGAEYASLALYAAAVSDDVNSQEADPVFTNPANDLHTCALQNLGTPIAGITDDYDCQSRSVITPAIGADECPVTNSTLNLTAFLQGFYDDINHMVPNLSTVGISSDLTETDTLQVSLWAPANLLNPSPDYSMQTVVHTDGVCTPMQFPPAVAGNSFYIQVKHRNHIETWSANPVAFTASTSYNFTTSQSQAFDDGFDSNPPMAPVAGGKFAFYGGDVNQDGGVDSQDANALEVDANVFAFGYNASDANGDGESGSLDANVIEANANLFIFYSRP